MISCIDGGLICGPVMAIIYIAGLTGLGLWLKGLKVKICKKRCKCECKKPDVKNHRTRRVWFEA